MVSIQILIILMIVSALIAIEARDALASIIALGVMGLELSLAFLLLRAPDIAVILLALEMVAFAVLARVIARYKPKLFADRDIFSTLTFTAFAVLFVLVCARAFSELPVFGMPQMKLADLYQQCRPINLNGSINVVSDLIHNFRGFDTLIVIMILFLSAVGILQITEKKQ